MIKPFVIHGVGKVTLYDFVTGREVLRITKQESATWNFGYEDTDVHGGDDLDPFDIFETARAQSVAFVDNRFDARQMEVATGKRVVMETNVPITEMSEGFTVPEAPGPYTHTLNFEATTEDETVRIRFNSDWEDLAPVPNNFTDAANVAEILPGAGVFLTGANIDIRITTVLTSGIESVATTAFTHVIADPISASLELTMPDNVLTTPTGMPNFDVNELSGFNIYIDDGVAPEYKSNAAPIAAGEKHTVLATPGAGAGAPDAVPTVTGQFTVASGIITFAAVDTKKEMLVDYVWRSSAVEAEVAVIDILKNCLRGYVRAIWRMDFRASDGTMRGMEMDIFKLKYTGDYNLEMTRSDATSHSMEFRILDPERADRKLVSWKIFPLGLDTGCN